MSRRSVHPNRRPMTKSVVHPNRELMTKSVVHSKKGPMNKRTNVVRPRKELNRNESDGKERHLNKLRK